MYIHTKTPKKSRNLKSRIQTYTNRIKKRLHNLNKPNSITIYYFLSSFILQRISISHSQKLSVFSKNSISNFIFNNSNLQTSPNSLPAPTMDISTLFKASVKTVTLRNKSISDTLSEAPKPPKKSTPRPRPANDRSFLSKMALVRQEMSNLHTLLLENRSAYLNLSRHLASNNASMSDAERDDIDQGAQRIIAACSQLLKELKLQLSGSGDLSHQNLEHRQRALALTEAHLKVVCRLYSEQRAIRVKRSAEVRRMSRLNASAQEGLKSDESTSLKIQEVNGDVAAASTYDEEQQLSPEDAQMLESENEQLYNELNNLSEEVRQVESQVVHIAELQEAFTENVLNQDKNLDLVMDRVVGVTENVREANEQIREAIQRNAGLRVWILFFLLVMSFSLLFLDWYNP